MSVRVAFTSRQAMLFLAVAVEGALVVAGAGGAWLGGVPITSLFPVAPLASTVGWGLLAMVPLLLSAMVLTRWELGPCRRFRQSILRPILTLTRACTLTDLVVIAALAGLGEELFFRGFIQQVASAYLGLWGSVLLASALFGALHWLSTFYAVWAMVVGIYLGGLFWLAGSLWIPVIAHGGYDLIVLCLYKYHHRRPYRRRRPG